jgi:hypothetical protein
MYIPSPSADFELAPAGTHFAACYRVLDLGTQETAFDGKKRHQIRLAWELCDEAMRDGRPFSISKTYTWTMNKRGSLRAHLEAWRGAPFTDENFSEGPKRFNIKTVLDTNCLVTVAQQEFNGETRAFVSGVGKILKGQAKKHPINPCVYLWLEPTLWDPKIFELLHEKTRETIAKSPEYECVTTGKPIRTESENPAPADMNDEIPF